MELLRVPRVLVVDDSRVVLKIVEATLWRERIEVVTATDGLSALAAVTDTQPNLVLLDILLPHLDGYQVCHVVRQHRDYVDLPIVFLSSRGSLMDRMRGKLAGATDYISKPFEAAELVWTVKRHLSTPPTRERTAHHEQRMSTISTMPTMPTMPAMPAMPKPKRWWRRS